MIVTFNGNSMLKSSQAVSHVSVELMFDISETLSPSQINFWWLSWRQSQECQTPSPQWHGSSPQKSWLNIYIHFISTLWKELHNSCLHQKQKIVSISPFGCHVSFTTKCSYELHIVFKWLSDFTQIIGQRNIHVHFKLWAGKYKRHCLNGCWWRYQFYWNS